MPTGIDYSKFDKIVDSSDEEDDTVIRSAEPSKPGGVNKPKTPDPGAYNTNTTTAKAGFVLRVPTRTREGLPMYINVCSALCVAEPMKASASNLDSLGATFPYQLGDPREDHDGTSPCYVVEAMYSSKTLQATSNKQVHEELIKASILLCSQNIMPLHEGSWTLCTREEIRERDGTFFFAPGKLSKGVE